MILYSLLRNSLFCILILLASSASAQKVKDVGNPRLLLPVRMGTKWGYADTTKKIIITPQYDAANPFNGGIAVVEKNKKAFAIDPTGKILTPEFDQMMVLEDTILSIYLNEVSDSLGGFGICTKSGIKILDPAYDEIVKIDANLYSFRKDTLWGVVNRNGIIYTPPLYTSIELQFGDYLQLHIGKKVGLMSHDGKLLLEAIYSSVYVPNKWVVAGRFNKTNGKLKKGWGGFNHSQELFIPYGMDSIYRIGSYFIGVAKKDTLACYFSRSQNNSTSFAYKKILAVDLFWAQLIDFFDQSGLVDTTGKVIIPVQYADVTIGGNGFWFVSDKNKKWGFYNASGDLKLAPSYSGIMPFRTNVTVVYEGNLQGLINTSGELLIPPGNQQIIIRGTTVKIIRSDNTATFIKLDANGKIIDKSDYDEFRVIKIVGTEAGIVLNNSSSGSNVRNGGALYFPTIDSLSWFMHPKTGLWGLRNTYTNDTLITAQFNSVEEGKDGYAIVGIHQAGTGIIIDGTTSITSDKLGLVQTSTGKIILKANYSCIHQEDLAFNGFKGFVRVTLQNGSMALVSTDGLERTMPFMFIDNLQNGYARICITGKWTIEDPGERVSNVFHFSVEQSINVFRTFGVASTSKDFMDKNICIAGGKWGYIDSTGHITIAATYDGAKQVTKETGIVKLEKKWGMIDMKGATRIPLQYDALYYMTTDTNTFVVAQMNGIRYGYIDKNGNIKIPADLKLSKVLGNGFIGFSRTGKWGVMNSQGVQICNEAYHEILPFSEGKAAVRLGNKWGFIDTLGAEIIPLTFEKAGQFKSGLAHVVKNHRWGFIDVGGNVVIETKYMQAGNFSGNAAPVRTRDGYGLMNKEGKWIVKPSIGNVSQLDTALNGFFVLRGADASSVWKSDGKIIIPAKYEFYKYLNEGIIACRNGNFWALADTNGKMITGLIFENIKPFSEHYAAAMKDTKWGFIRKNGKFIIQPNYKVVGKFIDHLAYVYFERNSYIIDTLGNIKVRFKKDAISYLGYSEGKYLIASLNQKREIDKMFYLTRHGSRLNRTEYKEALLFQDGTARVRVAGPSWGLISFTGFYLIKPRFFALGPFEYGLARFQMRYTLGAFTLQGSSVLPVGYDAIYYDEGLEKIRFEKGNAMGYLFRDGSVCWPETE